MEATLLALITTMGPIIGASPWLAATIVIAFALSYFIIRITPSVIDIFKTVSDTKSWDEIKDIVKGISDKQDSRYKQIDKLDKETRTRLGKLETGQNGIKSEIKLIQKQVAHLENKNV